MSDRIGPQLDDIELAALRAALIDGRFSGASGDLGRAVMYAYVLWHRRLGSLAPLAG